MNKKLVVISLTVMIMVIGVVSITTEINCTTLCA
jgi:hypothetical protein